MVEVARAGINFADTHATRNDYLAKQSLPLIPGGEVAGTTADGRRVAALLANGGYAQKVVVPEAGWSRSPTRSPTIRPRRCCSRASPRTRWSTAAPGSQEGETIVVEAAGGGTGTLAVQLAKRAGGRVIGLASSEEKRELAARLGADATVDSRADDLQGGDPRGERAASRSTRCSR